MPYDLDRSLLRPAEAAMAEAWTTALEPIFITLPMHVQVAAAAADPSLLLPAEAAAAEACTGIP